MAIKINFISSFTLKGESKRGEASLIYLFPLPLDKRKGDKGGWGHLIKTCVETGC